MSRWLTCLSAAAPPTTMWAHICTSFPTGRELLLLLMTIIIITVVSSLTRLVYKWVIYRSNVKKKLPDRVVGILLTLLLFSMLLYNIVTILFIIVHYACIVSTVITLNANPFVRTDLMLSFFFFYEHRRNYHEKKANDVVCI